MNRFWTTKLSPLGAAALLFVLGCTAGVSSATPDTAAVASVVAATLTAGPACPAMPSPSPNLSPSAPLPQAVYFLSESSGSPQVWRLAPDGETSQQLTQAPGGVDSFDISANGDLAYVSNNQLWLLATDGALELLVDGSGADPQAAGYVYREQVGAPRFSPAGDRLAYARNGLHMIDMATGEDQHLLANQLDDRDESFVFPEELYFPLAWSPDGAYLLVNIAYIEGGSLGTLALDGEASMVRFQSGGMLCCHSAWTADSQTILLASPYFGMVSPGLWRFEASTGAESVLAEGFDSEDDYALFGWPAQSGDGSLYYFYNSLAGIPEGDVPLFMVRSPAGDLEARQQLRPESFNIREALWAPDGSLALLVENPSVPSEGLTGGTILLVPSDGSPTRPLAGPARALRWGP